MKVFPFTACFLMMLSLIACDNGSASSAANNAKNNTATNTKQASPSTEITVDGKNAKSGSAVNKTYSGFDMAGIYLGMSPEEVEATIKDYAPELKLKKDLISFSYNAMGSRYKTDSFVNYMGGNTYGGKLSLGVRLSSPPEPLKVVGITRGDRHEDSPIPQAVYVESLVEKYGPPALDSGATGTGPNAERTLEWPFGNGTVQCFSKGGEASTSPVLERMSKDGRRYPDPTPEFTQKCISMMRYVLRGEPVIRAAGSMLDVPASARAEFETQAWIQTLIDEKSKPGTEKPRL